LGQSAQEIAREHHIKASEVVSQSLGVAHLKMNTFRPRIVRQASHCRSVAFARFLDPVCDLPFFRQLLRRPDECRAEIHSNDLGTTRRKSEARSAHGTTYIEGTSTGRDLAPIERFRDTALWEVYGIPRSEGP